MAKKEFTAISAMTKKQKLLNFLKIFGFSFASVMAMVAGVVLYVWATGGFNPPYVPLESWAFSQAEYVIDGNKEIAVDDEGQIKNEYGNLVWNQLAYENDNPKYEFVTIIPNEGCTELDAEISIDFSSNPNSPVLQLVEDENTKIVDKDEENPDKLYYKYNVKIGSPIYLKPLTKTVEINGEEIQTNIGGWVKLTATQELLTTSCWVFVDSPVLDYKIELNQEYEEENGVYNVYPNSPISVKSKIEPSDAFVLPSSNIPTTKGSTNFTNSKTIFYQTSNSEIATIDENGVVTINEDKEGEEFSITAYVIAKYNNVGNEPSLQDFEEYQDPLVPYTKALEKMRVWSNTLTFKINEIAVQSITTGSKAVTIPSYNVFEKGTINFSNEVVSVERNNYFVDLILTNESDVNYKSALLNQIVISAGYEVESSFDPSYEQYLTINNDYIVINGKNLIDASKYVTLEKIGDRSYQYKINQYSQNKFYFIFSYSYELEDESICTLYDYVQFSLAKTELKDLGVSETSINLNYNSDTDYEVYNLSNINVTLTPENSTYNYVMFFAPSNNGVISCQDSSIKVSIANQDCNPVSVSENGIFDYTKIMPTSTGRTNVYAVVLRTTDAFDEGSEVNFVINNGYVEVERYSEAINITVTNTVVFDEIFANEEESEKIESINPTLSIDDEDYNFANGCDIFAKIYRGGYIDLNIAYQGTADALENNRLAISHIEGSYETVALVANQDNTNDGVYIFEILANSEGYAKFQVYYDNEAKYTIGIKVLSTELIGMGLSGENTQICVSFESDNNGNATNFSWNDLEFDLTYDSPKADATDFELRTYNLPDEFDTSLLDYYVEKNYNEVIAELPEEINTISKFIKSLTLDESVIKIYNNESDGKDGKITIGETTCSYDFVGIGRVLVVAQSTVLDVCSNPILLETICPVVTVKIGDSDITGVLQTKDVLSFGELSTIEGKTSSANQINLIGTGNEFITFFAEIDGKSYNINNLINFRFENQTEDRKSILSGATIENTTMTLADISREITENIVVYTNFGYVNDEFYQYNLKPNYKLVNNYSTKTYKTPSTVNLFEGTATALPTIVITNNDSYEGRSRLYIPVAFEGKDADELKGIMPSDFVDSFYYADIDGEDKYYHIYPTIRILNNSEDYYVNGAKISLEYKEVEQKININIRLNSNIEGLEVVNSYSMRTSINVKPGITPNFVYNQNGVYVVDSTQAGSGIDLLDKLTFANDNNYEISIKNIDFAVNTNTSDNLSFFKNDDYKYVETFVPYQLQSDDYISESEYEALTEKLNYKYYYILTNDVSEIDNEKTYYLLNENNEFVEVSEPTASGLSAYYEKVYSTKTFYGANTHFEVIDSANIDNAFISKYYEKIYVNNETDYLKTDDTEIISNKNYYIFENNEYVIVENPVIENINNYYEQYYDFAISQDNQIDNNKTYYYKKNYIKLAKGADISVVYDLLKITLNPSTGNLSYDENLIKAIVDPICLIFSIDIDIKNGDAESSATLYYNLRIE